MLIKSTAEAKKFVNDVNKGTTWDSFESSVRNAEMLFIIPAIGQGLYNELDLQYNTNPETISAINQKIFPALQHSVMNYCMYVDLQTRIATAGNAGFTENTTTHTAPVRQWAHTTACVSHYWVADRWLELALFIMESKVGVSGENYALWESSTAFTLTKDLFFSSTSDFENNGLINIGGSHTTFLALRSWIAIAEELYITPLITDALYNDLKTKIKAGTTLTEPEKILIKKIKVALAQWAMYQGVPNISVTKYGSGIRVLPTNDEVAQSIATTEGLKNQMVKSFEVNAKTFSSKILEYLTGISSATVFPDYYNAKVVTEKSTNYNPVHLNEGRKSFMV